MVFGDDYQSNDYFELNEAGKWWKLQVQNSEEKMGDRHHPVMAIIITFKVMASPLQEFLLKARYLHRNFVCF